MSKILVVVEIGDGKLRAHSLPGITCGQQVAGGSRRGVPALGPGLRGVVLGACGAEVRHGTSLGTRRGGARRAAA